MRKLAVSITKGGTGKTTTTVNLAAGLARQGARVLVVDADSQGHAGQMLGLKPEHGLAEVISQAATPETAVVEARPNLYLLAGGRALAGVRRLIARKDFGSERTLAEALEPIEGQYDFVIFDTAPGWDPLTVNVLFYATEVLAPVSLEVLTIQGLVEFIGNIESMSPSARRSAARSTSTAVTIPSTSSPCRGHSTRTPRPIRRPAGGSRRSCWPSWRSAGSCCRAPRSRT